MKPETGIIIKSKTTTRDVKCSSCPQAWFVCLHHLFLICVLLLYQLNVTIYQCGHSMEMYPTHIVSHVTFVEWIQVQHCSSSADKLCVNQSKLFNFYYNCLYIIDMIASKLCKNNQWTTSSWINKKKQITVMLFDWYSHGVCMVCPCLPAVVSQSQTLSNLHETWTWVVIDRNWYQAITIT